MKVNIKRLHKNATIPFYAKESDAGMDLVITDIKGETEWDISYGFGISMEIPEGFMGLVLLHANGGSDGITYDCWLQMGTYGEVIYG